MVPGQPPPSLQYLTMVDQLIVQQKVIIGVDTANKYKVFDSHGQQVYDAKEETDCCSTRQCFGLERPFDMNITDMQGTEVIHLNRPLRCQSCCFPCCLQELEVSSPPGTVVGKIEQQWSIIHPEFVIKDQVRPAVFISDSIRQFDCSRWVSLSSGSRAHVR